MRIHVELAGIRCPKGCAAEVERIVWKYCGSDDRPTDFHYETDACSHTYISRELRNELVCMSVGTERSLDWQLSYRSKWTTLCKLMRRFHDRLTEDDQRVTKLKGFYKSLVGTFYEVDEFKNFADSLTSAASDFGGNLPYGLDIDFSAYDASNFFKSLRVFPHLDGEEGRTRNLAPAKSRSQQWRSRMHMRTRLEVRV